MPRPHEMTDEETKEHGFWYAERARAAATTDVERDKWTRIIRILRGEPLNEIYPEADVPERIIGLCAVDERCLRD